MSENDKELKLYHDENCLFEVTDIKFHEPTRAGEVGEQEGFVKNVSTDEIRNIKITAGDKEVRIVDTPTALQANEVKKIVFIWEPSKERIKALKTPVDLSWDRIILVEE